MGLVSAVVAWAVSDHQVFRAIDSGRTWSDVSPPGHPRFAESFFLDSSHAWLTRPIGAAVVVLRTVDGGRSWSRGEYVPCPSGECISSFLSFIDPSDGWLAVPVPSQQPINGGALVWRTRDGGATWRKVGGFSGYTPIEFTSETTGWAGGPALPSGNPLVQTSDGGRTWKRAKVTTPGAPFEQLVGLPAFFGGRTGVVEASLVMPGGSANTVVFFVTRDAGATTWRRTVPISTHGFAQYFEVPGTTPTVSDWLLGSPEGLDVTHDGGHTWDTVTPNVSLAGLTQVDFVTAQVGAILEGFGPCSQPIGLSPPKCLQESRVFWTTDGGHTFVGADPGVEH